MWAWTKEGNDSISCLPCVATACDCSRERKPVPMCYCQAKEQGIKEKHGCVWVLHEGRHLEEEESLSFVCFLLCLGKCRTSYVYWHCCVFINGSKETPVSILRSPMNWNNLQGLRLLPWWLDPKWSHMLVVLLWWCLCCHIDKENRRESSSMLAVHSQEESPHTPPFI